MKRDQLPGDFLRSKTGTEAYIVLTSKKRQVRNEQGHFIKGGAPLVRLRFKTGALSDECFTIAELEAEGVTFLKRRPKGFPAPESFDDKAKANRPKKAKPRKTTERKRAELPPVGTKLKARYKKQDFEVTVVADGVQWNGEVYRSLSKAGCAITGRPTCNGPAFFGLRDGKKREAAGEVEREKTEVAS